MMWKMTHPCVPSEFPAFLPREGKLEFGYEFVKRAWGLVKQVDLLYPCYYFFFSREKRGSMCSTLF